MKLYYSAESTRQVERKSIRILRDNKLTYESSVSTAQVDEEGPFQVSVVYKSGMHSRATLVLHREVTNICIPGIDQKTLS